MPKFKGGLDEPRTEGVGMTKAKQYRVIRNGVTALVGTTDGRQVRAFSMGALLPPDVEQDQIDHLLSVNLIAEDDDEADRVISEQLTGPIPGSQPRDTSSLPRVPVGDVPAASAGKPEWVEYAKAQGMSEVDADAATKAELQAKYGS